MNVLAFDTCFAAVSAAVRWKSARGEWLLREVYEPIAVGHAERLLPIIQDVMDGAGLGYSQIDRIAVTIGPGGFTGLRAGVAAARAMSLATGKPVVGLGSLAIMAERANLLLNRQSLREPLAIAVDARRGAVYLQVFGENSGHELSAPALLDVADAARALPQGPLLIAGSGAALVATAAARTDVQVVLPDLQPHARWLTLLAPALQPLHPVTPLYLRPADAKPPSDPSLPRRP